MGDQHFSRRGSGTRISGPRSDVSALSRRAKQVAALITVYICSNLRMAPSIAIRLRLSTGVDHVDLRIRTPFRSTAKAVAALSGSSRKCAMGASRGYQRVLRGRTRPVRARALVLLRNVHLGWECYTRGPVREKWARSLASGHRGGRAHGVGDASGDLIADVSRFRWGRPHVWRTFRE